MTEPTLFEKAVADVSAAVEAALPPQMSLTGTESRRVGRAALIAALKVLREPSPEMVRAFEEKATEIVALRYDDFDFRVGGAAIALQAMLDALIREAETPPAPAAAPPRS